MQRKNLFILIFLCSLINISYAQQKVYKCVSNGEVIYSNDEKDNKCKQVEMMEINKFNPSSKQSGSNKDIKNNTQIKQEIYPEPIPLDYVPEKPAPINEELEKKKLYEQKIKQIEQGYFNLIGTLLKLKNN